MYRSRRVLFSILHLLRIGRSSCPREGTDRSRGALSGQIPRSLPENGQGQAPKIWAWNRVRETQAEREEVAEDETAALSGEFCCACGSQESVARIAVPPVFDSTISEPPRSEMRSLIPARPMPAARPAFMRESTAGGMPCPLSRTTSMTRPFWQER